MGAMYRLKAYFGMVPAEDMAEYADEPPVERYAGRRREYAGDRWGDGEYAARARIRPRAGVRGRIARRPRSPSSAAPMFAAPRSGSPTTGTPTATTTTGTAAPPGSRAARSRWSARGRPVSRLDREPVRGAGLGPSAVRGALAMDTDALREPALRDPTCGIRRCGSRPCGSPPGCPSGPAPAVPEQRLGGAAALARITTLQPRSYNEARTIGERYRDGVPVIMNLTELDDAAAKRLVDFAAGLAFALRGSIDKVTSRVFLLTPADVEVSADDARRLAERGLFRQD